MYAEIILMNDNTLFAKKSTFNTDSVEYNRQRKRYIARDNRKRSR